MKLLSRVRLSRCVGFRNIQTLFWRRCCVQRAKPGSFLVAVAVFWGKQPLKYVELVGYSETKWFANAISIKSVERTTEDVRVRPLGDTLPSCTAMQSLLISFKLLIKLAPVFLVINLGHAGVTNAEVKPRRGSKTGQKTTKNPKTSLSNAVSKIQWRQVFLCPFFRTILKQTWRKTLILFYVLVFGISVKHLFTFPKWIFLSQWLLQILQIVLKSKIWNYPLL